MNILELISNAKYYTRTPQLNESSLTTEVDDALTRDFWMKMLWNSQDFLHSKIIKLFEEYFIDSTSITFASGTNEYSLPGNCIRTRMVERVGSNYNENLHPIILDKRNDFTSLQNDPFNIRYPQFFYPINKKIGIVDAEAAGTATVFYVRRLPKLMYATLSSYNSTTLVWPASPTLGFVDDRNDYYNGCKVRIVSATGGSPAGAGQILDITDYVASTRTMTYDTPTTALGGTTLVAEVVCEIPEEHHNCVSLMMAAFAELSDKDEISPDLKEMLNTHVQGLIDGIIPIQSAESAHVNRPYPGI